jgi:hypothetical protein
MLFHDLTPVEIGESYYVLDPHWVPFFCAACGFRTFHAVEMGDCRRCSKKNGMRCLQPGYQTFKELIQIPNLISYEMSRISWQCVKNQISYLAFVDKCHALRASLNPTPMPPGWDPL